MISVCIMIFEYLDHGRRGDREHNLILAAPQADWQVLPRPRYRQTGAMRSLGPWGLFSHPSAGNGREIADHATILRKRHPATKSGKGASSSFLKFLSTSRVSYEFQPSLLVLCAKRMVCRDRKWSHQKKDRWIKKIMASHFIGINDSLHFVFFRQE